MDTDNVVFVARQYEFIIGVFTSLEMAKEVCQTNYNSYRKLRPEFPDVTLKWKGLEIIDGHVHWIACPVLEENTQAVYHIEAVLLNVNHKDGYSRPPCVEVSEFEKILYV